MAKERIIWSNLDVDYDEWKEDWKSYLEDNLRSEEEVGLYEWVDTTLGYYLEDECANLNKEVDGVIVAFADFGLWDGRHNGGGIVGTNVRGILSSECDYCKWYCDRYNVRFEGSHHDGTNYYLYRVAKDMESARALIHKIAYEGMSEKEFMRATKSLRPYVAKVYGW